MKVLDNIYKSRLIRFVSTNSARSFYKFWLELNQTSTWRCVLFKQ